MGHLATVALGHSRRDPAAQLSEQQHKEDFGLGTLACPHHLSQALPSPTPPNVNNTIPPNTCFPIKGPALPTCGTS